jgi:branched-chain amino acid transport system ATP-binding protein
MALLELKNVTKYFGGLAAVSDFSMDVAKGEIRGLIGPNGAGKTTMFNLITNFYPVTSGSIYFNGEDITGVHTHKIAGKGLVRSFQSTILFMEFTVMENVMTALHLRAGMSPVNRFLGGAGEREKENEEEARSLIKFFGMENFENELAMNLPHGFQRALGVSMASANHPKMLMLDEPVTGMNPVETDHMMGLIKKIRDEWGMTVLLVEHDMRAVMGLCDGLTVISFGKKLAEGKPEEIQRNRDVIEAYLGKDTLEQIAT